MTTPSILIPVPGTTSGSEYDNERGEPGRERPAHDPAHGEETASPEDQLFDRLLQRLATMGVASDRPPSTTEPHGEHYHDSHEEHPRWERSWKEWQYGWSSHDNWKTDDWKDHRWKSDDPKYDRPYISHLDFPKFDGRREEYSSYKYAVLNLKSQCVPRDYKYLAPKLIAHFTGSMSDDAKAMELSATDFQVDDGVEQLLRFIRKRLHITDLNLETEAF